LSHCIPQNGDTAIIKATRKGHVDVIRELLLGAAQVDLRTEVRCNIH